MSPCGLWRWLGRRTFAALTALAAGAVPAVGQHATTRGASKTARSATTTPRRITVESVDSLATATDASGLVSVAVRIKHDAPNDARLTTAIEAPSGWRVLSGGGTVTARPSQWSIAIVALQAPRSSAPGVYDVRVSARSAEDSSLRASTGLRVAVPARRTLAVRAEQAPAYALSGQPYRLAFVATNTGNVDLDAHVRAYSVPALQLRVDSLVAIPAGRSRTIELAVSDSFCACAAARHDIRLQMEPRTAESDDRASTVEASLGVTVIARAGEASSARATVRSVFALAVPNAAAGGRAYALSGAGPLDAGGRVAIDYVARFVEGHSTAFGDYSRYAVRIATPATETLLGDQLYSLSPLTEPGRYSRGAGFRASGARWRFSGFASAPVSLSPMDEEGGAAVIWGDEAPVTLGGSAFVRHDSATKPVVAALARLSPLPSYAPHLEVEYARNAAAESSQGSAWRAGMRGQGDRWSYELFHSIADSAFYGYGPGSHTSVASTTVAILPSLGLAANYSRTGNDPGPQRPASEWSQRALSASGFGFLDLSATETSLGVDMKAPSRERALSYAITPIRGKFGLSIRGANGQLQSEPLGRYQLFQRVGVEARVSSSAAVASAYAERTEGPTLYWPWSSERTLAGATIAARVARRSNVDLSVYGMSDHGLQDVTIANMDAAFTHATASGASLVARLRAPLGPGWRLLQPPLWQVSIAVPFGFPSLLAPATARARLRLVERASGLPLDGALIRVGDKVAVTDRLGRAVIEGLLPTDYALSVVPRDGKLERATFVDGAASSRLRIPGSGTTYAEISVDAGARVAGHVRSVSRALSSDDHEAVEDAGGIDGALVILAGQQDTLRRITSSDGAFEFASLGAGEWRIIVARDGLAPEYVVMEGEPSILLRSGERRDVALHVAPRRRDLRVITRDTIPVVGQPPDGKRKP